MELLDIETARNDDDERFIARSQGLTLTSSLLLGTPTPYDEKEGAHARTLTIKKSSNYRLCPVKVTEGPMKGFQAIVLVPTNGFRFLDLPIEIRYIIYELSMPPSKTTLRLAMRENREKSDPKVVGVRYRFKATKAWREGRELATPLGRRYKWIKMDERTPMCLLLVNKQVSSEAFEVLYSTHTFHFRYPEVLYTFLKLNNASAKYLTNVELSGYYNHGERPIGKNEKKRCIERALSVLTKASPQALRSLHLQHMSANKGGRHGYERYQTCDAKVLVNDCIPLLNTVYRARQREKIATGVDEILKIGHRWCDSDEDWDEPHIALECQKFNEDVKRIVREAFLMDVE
ncbi:hypothetical protein PRZ48_003181 [Zasmidium cellare]|uniref:DUF7730 domain-containing protein n=1 Tax=Zasmidium cellare TaxID=395010 RepID=A0ABR0EVM7_ZASCE|nr:hypothetical protein PRZ48_003181 [Zasmidium cellare]